MKSKILFLALGILVLICLLFPVGVYQLFHRPTQQEFIQQVFGNQQNFDGVLKSEEVTVQRLYLKDVDRPIYGELVGYTHDAPISLSADQIQKIKSLLQNPKSYDWNSASKCIPKYGVLCNFHSAQQTIRVAFCFKCNMFGVFESDDDNAKSINQNYMFTPMRGQLVGFAKSIFPNDNEIQSLK